MEGLSHYEKEIRPWGVFERFTKNEPSTVKIITVHPGEAFSLQTHAQRAEFWYILEGGGMITLGATLKKSVPGDSVFIPRDTKHRLEAGENGCTFLEIAFGNFDENDITRIEDRYGRA